MQKLLSLLIFFPLIASAMTPSGELKFPHLMVQLYSLNLGGDLLLAHATQMQSDGHSRSQFLLVGEGICSIPHTKGRTLNESGDIDSDSIQSADSGELDLSLPGVNGCYIVNIDALRKRGILSVVVTRVSSQKS